MNVVASRARADGASRAPNAPCTARAATSSANPEAAPPAAEAIAKPASPATNVRFRPKMSDRRPPTSSSPPNASAYAVMTHWRSVVEKPSARWAEGSAMFTMVASSTTMSWAIPMTARISQRRRLARACAPRARA